MAVLFFHEMRFDVSQPERLDNDHFILSKGHAAPILWAVMRRAGIVSDEELHYLRDISSKLEGHPTPRNEWVRVATGSLGQGLPAGLGMALADRHDKRTTRTFVLLGDGELAEGSSWEAAQLAAYHQLDRVCAIIDVNGRGQTGTTMLEHQMETHAQRWEAFGWHTQVIDGHDPDAVAEAYARADVEATRPSAILARTIKGAGVRSLTDAEGEHGKPAPAFEDALAELGEPNIEEPLRIAWPASDAPVLPDLFQGTVQIEAPEVLTREAISPRKAFGLALRDAGHQHPGLYVLDGDVSNSTYTNLFAESFPERFVQSFIAEQNMVGMGLGLAQMGKLPLAATFAAFLTRAYDQIRMSGISGAGMLFAGTHAGVATGQDGPSQMGLEDVALFRSIPQSVVLQPCDGVSTFGILQTLLSHRRTGYLRLFRPDVPPVYQAPWLEFPIGGSHTVLATEDDLVAIFASGYTVHTALQAAKTLRDAGIGACVIDLYSIKPLDIATVHELEAKLGSIVTVEDHYPEGGLGEAVAAISSLPADRRRHLAVIEVPRSGTADALADRYGISANHVVAAVKELL